MERTGGLPCRDSVGEFETLERRQEKEKKKRKGRNKKEKPKLENAQKV